MTSINGMFVNKRFMSYDTNVICLNSLHKNLKFTKEEELNNSLNFLDVWIQRSVDGELLTKMYKVKLRGSSSPNFQ